MTKHTPNPDDAIRTRPWMQDEYMLVDGRRTAYTVHTPSGELQVRLPGGATATVEGLRALGRVVVMPRILRRGEPA